MGDAALLRRTIQSTRIALVAACLVCGLVGEATAYDAYRDAAGRPLRWADREVAVFVVSEAVGGVSVGAIDAAAKAAIATWSAPAAPRLRLVYGGLVGKSAGFDITLMLSDEGVDPRAGEPVGTVRIDAREGEILRADISVNVRDLRFGPAEAGDARLRADLRAVVTHLLGHALGLAHSRELEATMGFLPIDADKRSLEADDIDGLHYQYGGAVSGEACDACEGDGDCRDGMLCLRWPNGSAYCAAPCVSHDECRVGQSCGVWAEGTACLPNGGHCAPDLESAAHGKPCASDLSCGDLFCLAIGDKGFCTIGCAGFCGQFGSCTTVQIGGTLAGLCLPDGGVGGFGAPCEAAPDCASLQCAATADGGGRCAIPCSAGCPSDAICDELGFCVRPGTRPVGWPCASGFDCSSGHCAESGGTFARVCALPCELAGDCPDGTGCTPTQAGTFCLPFGAPPEGFPCLQSGACGPDRLCVASDVPDVGVCRDACDPYGDGSDCLAGGRCRWEAGAGYCAPSGGGALVGAPCGPDDACRVDLVCVEESGVARCAVDCDPATGAGCGSTEQCVALAGDESSVGPPRGVCATDAGASPRFVPPAPEPAKANFAARPLGLSDVVRWEPPKDPPTEEDTGCSAQRRAAGSSRGMWLLAGVALLFGVLRQMSRRATSG